MFLKKKLKLLIVLLITSTYFISSLQAQDIQLKQMQYLEIQSLCEEKSIDKLSYTQCLMKEIDVESNIEIINDLADSYKEDMQIEKAIVFYKLSSKKNSSYAMYNLGKLYNNNVDNEFYDEKLALKWFLKASKNRYKDSTCLSSKLLKNIDEKKEIVFLNTQVKKGNVKALTCIALKFQEVKKYKNANKWFLKALSKGDLEALYHLSYIHHRFLKDEEKAMFYYKKLLANVKFLNNEEKYKPSCLDLKEITKSSHRTTCLDYLTKTKIKKKTL